MSECRNLTLNTLSLRFCYARFETRFGARRSSTVRWGKVRIGRNASPERLWVNVWPSRMPDLAEFVLLGAPPAHPSTQKMTKPVNEIVKLRRVVKCDLP